MVAATAVGSVVAASAQSVAKVYAIGAAGYCSVLLPKQAPLLPRKAVGLVARFSFNVLTLSLIYSTIAKAVTVSALGSYWFVVVGAFFVLGLSYLTATLLQCVWPIHNRRDFYALRISATFPNIVALPILIFPSLCEYAVVYEAFGSTGDGDLRASCVDQANTMIFCYFFSWSLCFWSLGHPQLMKAARMESSSSDETIIDRSTGRGSISSQEEGPESSGTRTAAVIVDGRDDTDANTEKQQRQEDESGPSQQSQLETWFRSVVQSLWTGIKQVATSAGFLAMLGGFVTACVPPLQEALFEPAGPLRFLGAALETMGGASSSLSTMIVAASLVPPPPPRRREENGSDAEEHEDAPTRDVEEASRIVSAEEEEEQVCQDAQDDVVDQTPIMSDPNFGPYRRGRKRSAKVLRRWSQSVSQNTRQLWRRTRSSKEQRRLHLWFIMTRLVVSPAVVTAALAGLDCGGYLSGVPALAKLVVLINACLPGALIVVVLLKSNPALSDTAAAVAKVYLPSYLLSIVTIAAWTAVGLLVTIPGEDGKTFCER